MERERRGIKRRGKKKRKEKVTGEKMRFRAGIIKIQLF